MNTLTKTAALLDICQQFVHQCDIVNKSKTESSLTQVPAHRTICLRIT